MDLLDDRSIDQAIADTGWTLEKGELVFVRKCGDFAGAMRFVESVAALAEEADHHPDIYIRWDTVTLALSTHSRGGITQADVDLARRITEATMAS